MLGGALDVIIMMRDPPPNRTEWAPIVDIVCNLMNSHILAWEVFPDGHTEEIIDIAAVIVHS